MAKWKEDLDDIQAIHADVLRFARMKFEDFKKHLDEHPEDRLQHINLPDGGSLRISAESARRFSSLTKRQIAVEANRGDLDRKTLERSIRGEFVQMFLEEGRTLERPAVDKMLARATKKAKQKHRSVTHYLPCIVVGDHEPSDFAVGPVRFIHQDKFFSDYGEAIERDHNAGSERNRERAEQLFSEGKILALKPEEEWRDLDRKMLEWVHEYYKSYRWIAEVTVPPCDGAISRLRAEITVQAALDVLKLFAFGWYDGRRVHLAMAHGVVDKTANVTKNDQGQFVFSWSRRGTFAGVDDGWFERTKKASDGYFELAEQVIATYLEPVAAKEVSTRWLDALNWYGQAVSERIPSAQVVKYVAALERLTITEKTPPDDDRGLTDAVTRRAGLFASFGDEKALHAVREEAREMYRWRSDLMHGRNSPVSKDQSVADEVKGLIPRADKLTRNALIGALGEYAHLVLDDRATSKDLEQRLRVLESAYDLVPIPTPVAASYDATTASESPRGLRAIIASIMRWFGRFKRRPKEKE